MKNKTRFLPQLACSFLIPCFLGRVSTLHYETFGWAESFSILFTGPIHILLILVWAAFNAIHLAEISFTIGPFQLCLTLIISIVLRVALAMAVAQVDVESGALVSWFLTLFVSISFFLIGGGFIALCHQ